MDSGPLISVITVSLNSGEFLEQTILSVKSQDYPWVEHIIIDGASTDQTIDIILKYQDHFAAWISEHDRGIYHAMNKGISLARGDLLIFLNADDFFSGDSVLSTVASMARDANDVSVFYGNIHLISPSGRHLRYIGAPLEGDQAQMLDTPPIPHPATFIRASVMREMSGFDENFRIAGDYDLLLRLFRTHAEFRYLDVCVSNMRVGGVSSNIEGTLDVLKEIRQARILNSYPEFSKKLLISYVKAFLRRALQALFGERVGTYMITFLTVLSSKKMLWVKR
jgi:glycosyltransferase involved in cell wall biosynthesis